MTTFDEYVSFGIDPDRLLAALKKSMATKNNDKMERIYIGIPNKSKRIPDGSDFGRLERKADQLIMLKPFTMKGGNVYFGEIDSGLTWCSMNGNVTLSPWDCADLLKQMRKKPGHNCQECSSRDTCVDAFQIKS